MTMMSVCWGIFLLGSVIMIFLIWLAFRRTFVRSEEIDENGVYRINYYEGRAIFHKLFDQAMTELQKGNDQVAKELLDKFIKLEPDNAMGYAGLGLYYFKKDILEAQRYFEQAHDFDRKYIFPLLCLGQMELQHKNFHKAIDYFEKAMALKRNLPEIYLGLAKCYDELNQRTKALKYYKKFIQLAHPLFDLTEIRERVAQLSHNEKPDA